MGRGALSSTLKASQQRDLRGALSGQAQKARPKVVADVAPLGSAASTAATRETDRDIVPNLLVPLTARPPDPSDTLGAWLNRHLDACSRFPEQLA